MILIIDFGSQTAHLIGRRLRDMGVSVEYSDPERVLKNVKKYRPTGIIFSGGPASVYENGAPTISTQVFELGLPILGICYGWQLMAHLLGGKVEGSSKEYGLEILTFQPGSVFAITDKQFSVIMSHGDTVTQLPVGFVTVAATAQVANAAVVDATKQLYGVQFHPEVEHTEHGLDILRFFTTKVCGEIEQARVLDPAQVIDEIKKVVGAKKVICAVSGGVDSTVAAFLMGKAIGQNLIPVYVESGFMREGTRDQVEMIFKQLVHADLVVVEAQERFISALKGVTDPEKKRKLIGKLYVDIFQEIAAGYPEAVFLGQGTIYSDVIESKGSKKASKKASKIKSHHNVGGLPKSLALTLLEPLRYYYKDEVRALGRMAGLPEEVVMQQPFPGPGYAIRIRGEVTLQRLQQVKLADQIVLQEIARAGLLNSVFQCFAVMTGAYSTAVKGDARAFAEVVALRAYESTDVMTSQVAHISYDVLLRIASRIVNEVPEISRVVYDITAKPPATMEWE